MSNIFANEESRIIKKRFEGWCVKPYESLRNIIFKNVMIKNYVIEDKMNEHYNFRIDIIDSLISANENWINILKIVLLKRVGQEIDGMYLG